MNKRSVKRSTMLSFKGALYLLAIGVWIFVMSEIEDDFDFSQTALTSYWGSTALILFVVYIMLVLLELFVDVEDLD
jgi:uncharacterized membrane protein YidH (DUF202 family)